MTKFLILDVEFFVSNIIFLILGVEFFVSNIICEVVLGLFGPPYLALGTNC